MLITTLYMGVMENAYGYNRDSGDFAHTDVKPDRIFIDHNGTRSALDGLINGGGARGGDTIFVLALGDLGQGMAAQNSRKLIEGMGIIIEICPMPEVAKKPLTRGRPAFGPEPVLDAELRKMWGNPIMYTQAYVLKHATTQHGSPVTRNQLNHRYGNRYKKETQDG